MTRLLAISLCLAIGTSGTTVGQEERKAPEIQADVVYGHKDGLAMTMDVYQPTAKPNGAAVLFMVSGGWFSRWSPPRQSLPLFEPYLSKGYTVFAVRHGSSPRYTIPEAVSDVRRAVRFIRTRADRFQIDAKRIGVLGMSAGGHLALMLATTGDDGNKNANDPIEQTSSRVAAVAALVPPTDLRVAVWESPESLPAYRNFPALDLPLAEAEKYSPVAHTSPDDAAALVIMGGRDELVPPKHGTWIAEAYEAKGADHKLIVLPEAGHGLEGEANRERVVQEIVAWFEQHLANGL